MYTEHDFIIDILAVNQRSNYDQQLATWHGIIVSQSFINLLEYLVRPDYLLVQVCMQYLDAYGYKSF